MQGDDGTGTNNGSRTKVDRIRETVVILTVVGGCSFVAGAAKSILTPLLDFERPVENLLLWTGIATVVYFPAAFWYFKKYGKKK